MAASPLPHDRLVALLLIRRHIDRSGPLTQFLAPLQSLSADPERDCRWLALLVLAEVVEWYPDLVWQITRTYGDGADDDLRSVATGLLLPRLLRRHGEKFKPQVDAWTRQSPRFARAYALGLLNGQR